MFLVKQQTFKLSESHSSCGDALAVSLSSVQLGLITLLHRLGIPVKGKRLIQICQSTMVFKG